MLACVSTPFALIVARILETKQTIRLKKKKNQKEREMEALGELINKANVKALLIGKLNVIVIAVSAASMVILIATWAASINFEGNGLGRRYIASIVALIFQLASCALAIVSQRIAPSMLFFYVHQVVTILALMMLGIGMGMNDVVVEVCALGNPAGVKLLCGSHYTELFAAFIAVLTLMVTYAACQQRVVTFVDKGILDGIQGRSNGGIQQLP